MPIIKDDEQEPALPAPIQQPIVPKVIVEKTETFWSMLTKLGQWINRRRFPKTPDSLKQFGHSVWDTPPRKRVLKKKKSKPLNPIFHTD